MYCTRKSTGKVKDNCDLVTQRHKKREVSVSTACKMDAILEWFSRPTWHINKVIDWLMKRLLKGYLFDGI